ncbi:sensor histidine kinase [Streptomyces lydicus]|uniref:sensor histidine kinase n=1 Tax=Streptomyces lydicus TaxID=47763 RepID=UPI001010D97C|nr:ATP-binding protein [Streptomyces lydicus]
MTQIPPLDQASRPRHRRALQMTLGRSVLVVVLVAAASAAAVVLSSPPGRAAVAWCTAVSTVLVAVGLAEAQYRLRAVGRERDEAWERVRCAEVARGRSEADLRRLRDDIDRAARVLPWAVDRLRERASAPTVLARLSHEGLLPADETLRGVVHTTVHTLHQEHRRLTSAMVMVQGCGKRLHAAITDHLQEIGERKRPYWEASGPIRREDVRADLEALDARVSSTGLLTQRLLALSGARRAGRPWARPVALERVVRAAVGSCDHHRRVELALPQVPVAVAGPAVTAAIHALGELLDNALRFSPPTTLVRVSGEDAVSALVLHVDDSGLAMGDETLRRARETVDFDQPLDITRLSGSRLGLAAARLSAERFGLRITFCRSSTGGTRASIALPRQWLTTPPAPSVSRAPALPQGGGPPPVREMPPPPHRSAAAPQPPQSAARLPRRVPGATRSRPAEHPAEPAPPPARSPQETGQRMTRFRQATRAARSHRPDPGGSR